MASRGIWSKGGGEKIQDLLATLFASVLMGEARHVPMYVCSPYLSDFSLFDNAFGQFGALFFDLPDVCEKKGILFSDVLRAVSRRRPVRIVTIRHPSSTGFVERVASAKEDGIAIRIAADIYHEKGLLCDEFYVEGSMNFTYSGVCVRDEKVTCHVAADAEGKRKIDGAFLEFARLWERLAAQEVKGAL